MRIVQPSVAKRIAFATWARRNHIARRSGVTYAVPESVEVPSTLMLGAQVDGKPITEVIEAPKPKRARAKKPKAKTAELVEAPAPHPEVDDTPEPEHTPWSVPDDDQEG